MEIRTNDGTTIKVEDPHGRIIIDSSEKQRSDRPDLQPGETTGPRRDSDVSKQPGA